MALPSSSSSFAVPVVDISPFVDECSPKLTAHRQQVAREVDAACRQPGFMQIVGHGIKKEVIEGLGEAMDAFFSLPIDEKKKFIRPAEENRGFTASKSEALSKSLGVDVSANDFFEAFNVGASVGDFPAGSIPAEFQRHYAASVWPADVDVAGFRSKVTAYFEEAKRVARTMTRIFASALELEWNFFDRLTSHSIAVLRLNNYALADGTNVAQGGLANGMSAHTDYGLVTILWADSVPGLQILGGDHQWHDVLPQSGALLVNLGDLTSRLTNERWKSTLHRVRPPIVDGAVHRRRSAALFFDANADARVKPLDSCVDADHPPLYEEVTVDQHVMAKVMGHRVGVLNVHAEREAQRVRQADETSAEKATTKSDQA